MNDSLRRPLHFQTQHLRLVRNPRRIASSSFDPALKRQPQSLRTTRSTSVQDSVAQEEVTEEESNRQEVLEVEDPANEVSLVRHYSESQEEMVRCEKMLGNSSSISLSGLCIFEFQHNLFVDGFAASTGLKSL
eukprot:symbB.v1.2.034468.t1/scaffold4455.1/size39486/3